MGLLNLIKRKDTSSPRILKEEKFSVVGVIYYIDNVDKLKVKNKDYDQSDDQFLNSCSSKSVYQYYYINKPVKLIEEPKNKHDKNAIKVLIAGEHVGYIPRDECLHVKNILHKHEVKFISSFISGGKHKFVDNGNVFISDRGISIDIKIGYV